MAHVSFPLPLLPASWVRVGPPPEQYLLTPLVEKAQVQEYSFQGRSSPCVLWVRTCSAGPTEENAQSKPHIGLGVSQGDPLLFQELGKLLKVFLQSSHVLRPH